MRQADLFSAPRGPSLVINADGASRGNPGPAGAGWVIRDGSDGEVIIEEGLFLGVETNNRAEYFALLFALEDALLLRAENVSVRLDSELLVKQITGVYRVKNAALRGLYARIKRLSGSFKSFRIAHVPREENRAADRAANAALDDEAKRHPKKAV